MLISSYLTREILRPFVLICGVLLLLMVSYSALGYLADAASSLIPAQLLAILILAKTVAAFELFLPLALYITLLLGLGKLYSDQEISALQASGMSPFGLMRALLPLILAITVLTAFVSLYVRPWAYDLRYTSKKQAEQTYDFDRLESGYFYENEDSGRVYFVKSIDADTKLKDDIFVYELKNGSARVIYSDQAYHVVSASGDPPVMVFLDGTAYQLETDGTDTVLNFDRLSVLPEPEEVVAEEFKRKAATSAFLARSTAPEEVAEFQWRTTSAAKTFLMALLAILLAKTTPRQGRYGKLVLGVLLFFVVHSGSLVTKTWVEQGKLDFFPGMWSTVLVLLVLTIILSRRNV